MCELCVSPCSSLHCHCGYRVHVPSVETILGLSQAIEAWCLFPGVALSCAMCLVLCQREAGGREQQALFGG